jgi:hypothetical protein
MFIVKFYSGLGNQLFQYTIYLILRKFYSSEIKIDISAFGNNYVRNSGNGFNYGFIIDKLFPEEKFITASTKELYRTNYLYFLPNFIMDNFPKTSKCLLRSNFIPILRAKFRHKYFLMKDKFITSEPFNSFNGTILKLNENLDFFLDGLWQNYTYVDYVINDLKSKFHYKSDFNDFYLEHLNKINSTNSVFIHLRRGDFTSDKYNSTHNICGSDYFNYGIERIKSIISKPHFFIFSDNIPFAKNFFGTKSYFSYVESAQQDNNVINDFNLMINCKHSIIPNSTYSWWASILKHNIKGITIYPKYFVKNKNSWYELNSPSNWIQVNNI